VTAHFLYNVAHKNASQDKMKFFRQPCEIFIPTFPLLNRGDPATESGFIFQRDGTLIIPCGIENIA